MRRRVARLGLAIALGVVAVFGALILSQTPHARASSQGSVFVYPPAGGPATRVQLELHFFGDQHLYLIKVATKSTESGGCDHPLALTGEGGKPVQLGGPDVTRVEFDWPAGLSSNTYYFCVFPAAYPTVAPTATVNATPLNSPVATATPKTTPTPTPIVTGPNEAFSTIPFYYTRDASAVVALPDPNAGSVAAGAQVDVTLTKWVSQNRASPTSVVLTKIGQQDAPTVDAPVNAVFNVTTPPDSKGNCKLSVTIPASLNSGPNAISASQPYMMIVGGPGIYQRSDPFAVTPSLSPTVAVTITPTHVAGGSGSGGGIALQILGWLVAILAFLGAIGGVLYLALVRHRPDVDAPPPGSSRASAPWGATPSNLWSGPQQDAWGDGSSTWGQGSAGSTPDWDAPTEPGRWPGDRP
jgi:hypothetical protein